MGSSSNTSNHAVNGSKFDKSADNKDYNYGDTYNIEKHTGINQSGDYTGGSKLHIASIKNNGGTQCFGVCPTNLEAVMELQNLIKYADGNMDPILAAKRAAQRLELERNLQHGSRDTYNFVNPPHALILL